MTFASLWTGALLLAAATLPPQHTGARGGGPRRAAESCTTGQDLIVQALERMRADSPIASIEDADQLLKRAGDLCAESGEAWYYRSLVEARLRHLPQANYAMRQAQLFPSDALRQGLNPFILSTPPAGKVQPTGPIHERWALVIGISSFADSRIPRLDYTAQDAKAFAGALLNPDVGGFKPENVKILTDKEATLGEIKKAINWLARNARPEDLAVIYVASHGSPRSDDTRGATYVLTHDTELDPDHVDPDLLYASALSMVDLANAVATRLQALRTAVFLDTCYSGGAVGTGARSVLDDAGVSKATLEHISQGTGRVIFAASRDDQESLESKRLQHGYFTYYLVEALSQHPAMPLTGVFAYVREHVSRQVQADYDAVGAQQTPVMSQSADDADFAIGGGGHGE